MKRFCCKWGVARLILLPVAMMLGGCCGGGYGGYGGYSDGSSFPPGADEHVSRVNSNWDPNHIVVHDEYPANVEPIIKQFRAMQGTDHLGPVDLADRTTTSLWETMKTQLVVFPDNKAVLIANNDVAVSIDPRPRQWCTVKLDGDAKPRFIWLCREDSEHWTPVLYSWSGESSLSVIELPLSAKQSVPPLIVLGGRHAYLMGGGIGGPRPWLTLKSVPSVNGKQGALYAEDEQGNRWDEAIIGPVTRPSTSPATSPATTQSAQRVTVDQAGWMITQFIQSQRPQREMPLVGVKETTPQQWWDRLQMQTYEVNDGGHSGEHYQIHKGQVLSLGQGFGGTGINSWCITDFLGTGQPQLYYSFDWGSGITHGQVGMWSEVTGEIRSDFVLFGDMVELDQPDGKTLRLKTMPYKKPGMMIGTLVVTQELGKPPVLEVKFAENLPADLRENIKLLSELRATTQPSAIEK